MVVLIRGRAADKHLLPGDGAPASVMDGPRLVGQEGSALEQGQNQ